MEEGWGRMKFGLQCHCSEMEVNTNSYDKLKVLTHTTGLYNKEICKLKEECKNI